MRRKASALDDDQPARDVGCRRDVDERVGLALERADPQLERAVAERAVAQHRGRDDVEAPAALTR